MICLSGQGCVDGLRHALAFAAELRHRVIVNNESLKRVAQSLGLDYAQVKGVVRLLRKTPSSISDERLALVLMKDPGMTNADVAEVFGRPIRWAQLVRRRAQELREAEPIEESLEWIDDGLQPDYPMPDEIARRAKEVREMNPLGGRDTANRPYGIRQFHWRQDGAFIPVSFD
jgi:hypothetical protein